MFSLLYNLLNIIALYTAVMLLCFLLRAVIQLLSALLTYLEPQKNTTQQFPESLQAHIFTVLFLEGLWSDIPFPS